MKIENISEFTQDVRDLYLRTGIKPIEDIYFSLKKHAEEDSDKNPDGEINLGEFFAFVMNANITKLLNDASFEVLQNAFKVLFDMRKFFESVAVSNSMVDGYIHNQMFAKKESDKRQRLKKMSTEDFMSGIAYLSVLPELSLSDLTPQSAQIINGHSAILNALNNSVKTTYSDIGSIAAGYSVDFVSKTLNAATSAVYEGINGAGGMKVPDISPEKKTKIFTHILRNTSKRISSAINSSLPTPEGEVDPETERVLQDISQVIQTKDILADPKGLVQAARIPARFVSPALFSLINSDAQRMAYEIQRQLAVTDEENMPALAQEASEMIIQGMSQILRHSDIEVEEKEKPEGYYMTSDEALTGTPYDTEAKIKPLEEKALLEIVLILAVSHVLYYLQP